MLDRGVIRAHGTDRLFGVFINNINGINNYIFYTVTGEVSYKSYNASYRTNHSGAAKSSLLEALAERGTRHRIAAASGYIANW